MNRFPNVRRRFVRRIRAMLHAWQKFGIEAAEAEFHRKYNRRVRKDGAQPAFLKVLRGRIEFLRMIKGDDDAVYINYLDQFERLLDPDKPQKPRTQREEIRNCVWVLECETSFLQGTAFRLDGFGLVTCSHVIGPNTQAFRADRPLDKFRIRVVTRAEALDLAVFEIDSDIGGALSADMTHEPIDDDKATIVGFPDYRLGDTALVQEARISQFRSVWGTRRMIINVPIVKGASGGPLLNTRNKVIGIAATGADRMEENQTTADYGAIPITALLKLERFGGDGG